MNEVSAKPWVGTGRRNERMTTEERFWQKVEKSDGCWEWQGHTDRNGYGTFRISSERGMGYAHRFSYELAHGSVLSDPLDRHAVCVLHQCDNPPCVKPDHLFLGSQLENIRDRVSKGRTKGTLLSGADHRGAKLTVEQVEEMRRLYGCYGKEGWTQQQLADRFGVSRGNVSKVVKNKSYKELTT